ncbi:hypothetical protein TWF730_003248 [Orbilia blumenaviensis]|uniref:Uncharacterized protein n=1 Tax=Orbilia blumenaviensis TaxID=1796055 RepID=A0AAV9U6C7_9PEZI
MVAIKVALVYALTLFGVINAMPSPMAEPEVDYVNALVPGEGLPSPQELGLTNEDLTKPIPNGIFTVTSLPSDEVILSHICSQVSQNAITSCISVTRAGSQMSALSKIPRPALIISYASIREIVELLDDRPSSVVWAGVVGSGKQKTHLVLPHTGNPASSPTAPFHPYLGVFLRMSHIEGDKANQ